MSLSIYQSTVPVFEQTLNALAAILDKAAAHAEAKKIDPSVLLSARLRPDMLAFPRQVQIACDHAKNGTARLAGLEAPRFEDKEASIDELKARVKATLDFIAGVDPKALEANFNREIAIPVGKNTLKLNGADYLLHFCLPNYYFHLTTAYDILRYAGVEIGKRDFLGNVPRVTMG